MIRRHSGVRGGHRARSPPPAACGWCRISTSPPRHRSTCW
jgi:hypothetical protein